MPAKMNPLHSMWGKFRGLQPFFDFAHLLTKCNKGRDGGYGDWFYLAADRLDGNIAVIYSGCWDEDQPADDPAFLHAELFHMDDAGDAAEYTLRVQHLQGQPEFDEQP